MNKYLKLILILFLLGTAVGAQYLFDQQKKDFKASAGYQPLVIGNKALETFNLGLKPALSDYFWLQAIQYYGDWRPDHNYQKLTDYLTLTTELDPKFSYPYAFAALILPGENIPEGYSIAKKGINRQLPDWQIPYYLATAYHIYKGDKASAAKYFDVAARTPGAPDNLKYIAAAYNSSPGNRKTGEAIWQTIYDNSTDEITRDRAKMYLAHFYLLDFLEEAAAQYKNKAGVWPASPADLVKAGIIKEVPADPFGFKYQFTSDGRATVK